jgi:hemolysin III
VSGPPTGEMERPLLRGKLHEAAFYVTLAAGPALVIAAPAGQRLVAGVYALTLSMLFGISALYHRVTWSPGARTVMRRLDHAAIFLLIAGTYTAAAPLALSHGVSRWVLVVVWVGACLGVAQQVWNPSLPNPVTAIPYVALGWVAIAVAPDLYRAFEAGRFSLLLVGGIAYTVGAVAYALRRPNPAPRVFGYHEVFHALVIVGAGAHYAMIASMYLAA